MILHRQVDQVEQEFEDKIFLATRAGDDDEAFRLLIELKKYLLRREDEGSEADMGHSG